MPQLGTEIDATLQRAAQLAGEYLAAHHGHEVPVARAVPPAELTKRLGLALPQQGRPLSELITDMQQVLEYSVRTGHPRFFNQLFGGFDPAAILGEWITALVNTSMYTYEAAPVATLMEVELIRRMNRMVGFERGEGVFAPGGSNSNLMAALAARHRAFPHAKQSGHRADDKPVFFLSEEAHYSVLRAGAIMGMGLDAAVEVACDPQGRMRPDALAAAIDRALADGRTPFMVVATAGSTVAGAFDPIDAIAEVTEPHDIWLHVDASLGGSVMFSERHRQLMRGVPRAHSVTWNPHKMMGVPLSCSATLMREPGSLRATNAMDADYLFHGKSDACYDLGDLSLQCGRRVDAIKLWFSWQAHGHDGFAQRVDHFFEMSAAFRAELEARDGFELVREPQSTNVCFRYVPPQLRALAGEARLEAVGACTTRVRDLLTQQGNFLINYATLDGAPAYRMALLNAETSESDTHALLDEIEALSADA
ncbi:MAG: L-2,4-diaminobutyrate decarboxylase [Planctomycetota bacterium]|nr:MAG: L-2,4-diaminobutyrate decarboxylase [Planctomycetota bacterium]